MESHGAQEEDRRSTGLETCSCHQLKLLERNLLGLYAQEDVSENRSTWRLEGPGQMVHLKACDLHKRLEKGRLFYGKDPVPKQLELLVCVWNLTTKGGATPAD